MQSSDLQPNGNGFAIEPERSQTLDLTIDPPIVLNEKTYEHMHLHEPNGFQQVNAEKELATGMNVYTLRNYQIMLVALVSGWPRVAVERMPIRQIQEAFDFLAPFTQVGPATGAS